MAILQDITGKKYSHLTAVSFCRREKNQTFWLFECSCGERVERWTGAVCNGRAKVKSCGCMKGYNLIKHGLTGSGTYRIWAGIKTRCYNEKSARFMEWGGRGIFMCERWKNDFAAFLEDMGERPHGMSIERKDNNGPYSPENCVWATASEQARNTSRNPTYLFRGEHRTVAEISEITGAPYKALHRRLHKLRENAEYAVQVVNAKKTVHTTGQSAA